MHLSEDRLACIVEAVIDQYADRIRLSFVLPDLDTGANRFNLLQRSIATLEQSLASSGYYPLASRTATIFASVDSPVVAAPPATEDIVITPSELRKLCQMCGINIAACSFFRGLL